MKICLQGNIDAKYCTHIKEFETNQLKKDVQADFLFGNLLRAMTVGWTLHPRWAWGWHDWQHFNVQPWLVWSYYSYKRLEKYLYGSFKTVLTNTWERNQADKKNHKQIFNYFRLWLFSTNVNFYLICYCPITTWSIFCKMLTKKTSPVTENFWLLLD